MHTYGIVKKGLLLSILFLFLGIGNAIPCEIDFAVEGDKKEKYSEGDVVVVKVKVTFTHRVCTQSIKKTKFKQNGVKILGATDWKETSTGIWERKLKVKITEAKNGKVSISGTRTCDKTGGYGILNLEVE